MMNVNFSYFTFAVIVRWEKKMKIRWVKNLKVTKLLYNPHQKMKSIVKELQIGFICFLYIFLGRIAYFLWLFCLSEKISSDIASKIARKMYTKNNQTRPKSKAKGFVTDVAPAISEKREKNMNEKNENIYSRESVCIHKFLHTHTHKNFLRMQSSRSRLSTL